MKRTYDFHVVNVFAESTFGGNPLAVFPQAEGLSHEERLAITAQFNLSETTFITPSTRGAARVRVYSPGYEMDFAGHPTLGSAHVAREVLGLKDAFTFEFNVGLVPVTAHADRWEFKSVPVTGRPAEVSNDSLAAMLGLDASAVLGPCRWMSCGSEQLLIQLRSAADVAAAWPSIELLRRCATNRQGHVIAYVFAIDGQSVRSRLFWEQHGGVREDPGTGSACANLGGYLNELGINAPPQLTIEQGHAVGRLNVLTLRRANEGVFVGGRVLSLMRGQFVLE